MVLPRVRDCNGNPAVALDLGKERGVAVKSPTRAAGKLCMVLVSDGEGHAMMS